MGEGFLRTRTFRMPSGPYLLHGPPASIPIAPLTKLRNPFTGPEFFVHIRAPISPRHYLCLRAPSPVISTTPPFACFSGCMHAPMPA